MADHLGLDRFTYVGHSMGGVIGFELGLSYPDRLNKLVLIAPAPADGVAVPVSFRERAAKLHYGKDAGRLIEELDDPERQAALPRAGRSARPARPQRFGCPLRGVLVGPGELPQGRAAGRD